MLDLPGGRRQYVAPGKAACIFHRVVLLWGKRIGETYVGGDDRNAGDLPSGHA